VPLAGQTRLAAAAEWDRVGRLFALLRTAMQATLPAGVALTAFVIGWRTVVTVAAIAATIGIGALVLARDLTRRGDEHRPQAG
jgi:hypothetical protein